MIPAFIVLVVIAVALGGYIAFDVLYSKRKAAVADTGKPKKNAAADIPKEIEEAAPAIYEAEITETDGEAQSGRALGQSELRESVTAQEVDSLMRDEVAATLIERSDGTSDRTKTGIVNIDTLSEHFESGEVVTLDEVKKRVKGFNKQTTYLKVLARGTLDKALTIEADSFSLQAVKMIVLTGGTAVRKR